MDASGAALRRRRLLLLPAALLKGRAVALAEVGEGGGRLAAWPLLLAAWGGLSLYLRLVLLLLKAASPFEKRDCGALPL